MRVLFLCPFVPWPLDNGGKTRTYQLLAQAGKEAEIHLHLVRDPNQAKDAEDRLSSICASVTVHPRTPYGKWTQLSQPKLERWFHSPALRAALAEELATGRYDLVHLDELLLARVPPLHPAVPVVQHHHKLDTVLYDAIGTGGSLERAFDLFKLKRLERESTQRTKHHLLCSQEDADLLTARHGALDLGILPSGFDPDVFSPAPRGSALEEREPDHVLYLGSMDYGPNVDGVLWFHREVMPLLLERRPDLVLDIVGGNPEPSIQALAGDHVRVHGRAQEVVPWLRRTAAMVVPLRIGGGTRLKIAEALGVGTPTVSTTIGAEGLGLEHGEHILLADSPADFAARTAELVEDAESARALGERGRAFALDRFTWSELGQRLVAYWRQVAANGRA